MVKACSCELVVAPGFGSFHHPSSFFLLHKRRKEGCRYNMWGFSGQWEMGAARRVPLNQNPTGSSGSLCFFLGSTCSADWTDLTQLLSLPSPHTRTRRTFRAAGCGQLFDPERELEPWTAETQIGADGVLSLTRTTVTPEQIFSRLRTTYPSRRRRGRLLCSSHA